MAYWFTTRLAGGGPRPGWSWAVHSYKPLPSLFGTSATLAEAAGAASAALMQLAQMEPES